MSRPTGGSITSDDAVLAFVSTYATEHGFAPSIREIARACGLASASSVHRRLGRLERDGRIARSPRMSRAIRVVVQA